MSSTVSSSRLSLLIICKANECRSVFAVDRFREASGFTTFAISSAGVGALPGSPQCPDSLTEVSIEHVSQQVNRNHIETASIVLTMERGQKSRIAEMLPAARSKTFTLPEAAHLCESLVKLSAAEDSEFKFEFPTDWEQYALGDRFGWFVSQLNEVRSFVEPEMGEVSDAHGVGAESHLQTFAKIRNQVDRINEALMSNELRLEIGSV